MMLTVHTGHIRFHQVHLQWSMSDFKIDQFDDTQTILKLFYTVTSLTYFLNVKCRTEHNTTINKYLWSSFVLKTIYGIHNFCLKWIKSNEQINPINLIYHIIYKNLNEITNSSSDRIGTDIPVYLNFSRVWSCDSDERIKQQIFWLYQYYFTIKSRNIL